jgi:hypothetical protein
VEALVLLLMEIAAPLLRRIVEKAYPHHFRLLPHEVAR